MKAHRDGRDKHRGQSHQTQDELGIFLREATFARWPLHGALDRRSIPSPDDRGAAAQSQLSIPNPFPHLDRYAARIRTPRWLRQAERLARGRAKQSPATRARTARQLESALITHSLQVRRCRFRAGRRPRRSTPGSPWHFCYRTRFGGCPLSSAFGRVRPLAIQKTLSSPGWIVAPIAAVCRCPHPGVLSLLPSRRSVTAKRVELPLDRRGLSGSSRDNGAARTVTLCTCAKSMHILGSPRRPLTPSVRRLASVPRSYASRSAAC